MVARSQKSWLDWLVIRPSRHLPADLMRLRAGDNKDDKAHEAPRAEPTSGDGCLIM